MTIETMPTKVAGGTLSCLQCGHQSEWEARIGPRARHCPRCAGDLVIEEIRGRRVIPRQRRRGEDDDEERP